MAKTEAGTSGHGKTPEHKIDSFAEDLGALLGNAQTKAADWLGQRKLIAKKLADVRDTATRLLTQLGEETRQVISRGRPAGSKSRARGRKKGPGGPKKRTMSAKARRAISQAQKKRWAEKKAAGKSR